MSALIIRTARASSFRTVDYATQPASQGDERTHRLRAVGPIVDILKAGIGVAHPEIYTTRPADGGPIDLLSHALQCAELLAAWRPGDEALQVAGLLHDMAHHQPTDRSNDSDDSLLHGARASVLLEPLFGQRVARLIALHVPAERYLVTFDPDYGPGAGRHNGRSIDLVGGPMTSAEVTFFDSFPEWSDALILRRADDLAIQRGIHTRDIHHWTGVLGRVALARRP